MCSLPHETRRTLCPARARTCSGLSMFASSKELDCGDCASVAGCGTAPQSHKPPSWSIALDSIPPASTIATCRDEAEIERPERQPSLLHAGVERQWTRQSCAAASSRPSCSASTPCLEHLRQRRTRLAQQDPLRSRTVPAPRSSPLSPLRRRATSLQSLPLPPLSRTRPRSQPRRSSHPVPRTQRSRPSPSSWTHAPLR